VKKTESRGSRAEEECGENFRRKNYDRGTTKRIKARDKPWKTGGKRDLSGRLLAGNDS